MLVPLTPEPLMMIMIIITIMMPKKVEKAVCEIITAKMRSTKPLIVIGQVWAC